MVLHHFTNPKWFAELGSWEKEENISLWIDFAKKVIDIFGEYVAKLENEIGVTINQSTLNQVVSGGNAGDGTN